MPSRKVTVLLASLIALAVPIPSVLGAEEACVPTIDRSTSVARHWDEVMLEAIRRDVPAPTIHSRNLFHVSAAMWDAWAAYDPTADGVYVNRKAEAAPEDVQGARETAMSYAAYRILTDRYKSSPGVAESQAGFDASDGLAVPADRPHPDAGRFTRVARQPHRRADHRGGHGGRLTPAGRLQAGRLHAPERADDRETARNRDGRPGPLAAARPGRVDRPERASRCPRASRASSGRTGVM